MEDERRKRNAKLFVRILPSSDFSYENIKVEEDFKTLHVRCLQDFLPGKDHTHTPPEYWQFTTDGIFYKATQEDVFLTIMDGVLDKVLGGAEALLVCYGQAGSGKSYTSFGITSEFQERGLALRLIAALFDEKSKRQNSTLQFTMSCVEFLGQELVDLLETEGRHAESTHHKNVLSVLVDNEEDAMQLVFEAAGQRAVCDDAPYLAANRGHGILTIRVENKSLVKSQPIITSGTLHLVDLAGINSPDKNSWSRPHDIGAANLTKTFLEQILILLSNTCEMKPMLSQQLVCPLIRYLGNSLSNVAVMRFIGHICGLRKDLDLTLSTLRFSDKINALKCSRLKFNTEPHAKLVLENFEDEVADLTKQLEESTMLARESDRTNISRARVEHLRRLVASFLEGKSSAETIMALQQTPLAIAVFKEELDKLREEMAIVEYKIANMLFDDFQRVPSSPLRGQSRTRDLSSLTGSLGKEGRGKGKSARSSESKDMVRGSSLASRELKKKGGESKEAVKKQTKSPKESTHSIGLSGVASKDKFKVPGSKDGLKATLSASFGTGKSGNSSSKRLKRSGSHTVKKASHHKGGKSKEGLSKLDELSPSDFEPVVVDELHEIVVVLPSAPLPPHEAAWESFLATDVAELQAAVSQAQLDTEQAHICYSRAALRLAEARHAEATAQADLYDRQHQRRLRGDESYDAEGRILTDDAERLATAELCRRQDAVNSRLDKVKSAKVALDECADRLQEAGAALDGRFEEFCLATYQAPIPHVELENKDVTRNLNEEEDDITKHRVKYFQMLQQMFFSSSTMHNTHQIY